jgi:hypothetical protein
MPVMPSLQLHGIAHIGETLLGHVDEAEIFWWLQSAKEQQWTWRRK